MNKFILGSGIVGLLARHILGPEWKIVPFKRSRFYSYVPALADDYIVVAPDIAGILSDFGFIPQNRRHTRAFSFNGELIFSEQSFVKLLWNQKIFGNSPHPAAGLLTRTDLLVFKTTVSDLYEKLLDRYKLEIQVNRDLYGDIESIAGNHAKTNKTEFDFDKLVSTIPFDALNTYMGQPKDLPAADVWYYLVKTPALNFEGATDVLVADAAFDFFKVTHVAPQTYLFNCLRDLGNPGVYLGAFLNGNLEVQRHTSVPKALPLGIPPDLVPFESAGIYPVGCHGQWDMFMDVSSSIKRLQKLRNA